MPSEWCPWCLLVSTVVFGWSAFPGLVAMRRANVKKLNLKKKTSTATFHEAFPDMKAWALRASTGYMCLCFIACAMHAHFQPKALNSKNTCSCKAALMRCQALGIAKQSGRCSKPWASMGGRNSSQCKCGNNAIDVEELSCHHPLG